MLYRSMPFQFNEGKIENSPVIFNIFFWKWDKCMLIALRLGRYFAVNLEASKLRPTRRATMLARPNEGKGQEKKQRSQICYQGRRVSQMCRAVALPNFSENYLSLNFSNVFTTVPWKNIPRLLLVPINFKVFYNITKVSWYFYLGPPHTHAGPLQCLNHMD